MASGIREQPRSEEAEKIVLGSMLLEPDESIPTAEGIISADDFFSMKHRKIYQAIMHQFYAGRAADIVGVTQYLRDTGDLERAGGLMYVTDLPDYVTTTATLQHYIQIIISQSQKRKLISAGTQLVELGYHSDGDVAQMQETAMHTINEAIFDEGVANEIRPIAELEAEFMERIEAEKNTGRPSNYLTTGFKTLDERIFDLRGQLVFIAGSTSVGKSLFLLNMAYKQAKKGIKVGVISLEMTDVAIVNRLLIRHMGVSAKDRKYKQLEEIRKSVGEVLILPMWLVSLGTSSLIGILREMRQMVLQHGIQCIYVDYIQLIGDISSSQRVNELEEISRQLLLFTKKYKVGVVVGSQFSREVMGTGDKRPKLWMLRGSGGIENNSDIVIGLFRKDYIDKSASMTDGFHEKNLEMEIHWLKNRNDGEAGMVDKMMYQLDRQMIGDITYASEDGQ